MSGMKDMDSTMKDYLEDIAENAKNEIKPEDYIGEAEQRAREKARHIEELLRDGFLSRSMRDWTFERDNGQNAQMPVARKYVQNWEQMKEKNIGLLIWGDVGCGKSFLAGAIANALIDQEVRVKMTNFTAILNDLSSTFEGRNEYLNRLCSYPLLIIDDFGMERGTEYDWNRSTA